MSLVSSAARSSGRVRVAGTVRAVGGTSAARSFATETESRASSASASASSELPPHQLPLPSEASSSTPSSSSSSTTTTTTSSSSSAHPSPPKKPRLYPQPRPSVRHHKPEAGPSTIGWSSRAPSAFDPVISHLPPSFGRNQLLTVSSSKRALLESIVGSFNAPIRYAFAYGSGVFEQDGYAAASSSEAKELEAKELEAKELEALGSRGLDQGKQQPMLDFMFAVTHPAHFHSINLQQNPSHYSLNARLLGSDYISYVQGLIPGLWFNTYVPMGDVTIKYGVTHIDNLCSDLLNWDTLYMAGRMHKPVRIIKDNPRVRLTQQVNLTSAVRAALLTLPAEFTERELFTRIASLSYAGDPRMWLPAENRGKVDNIVGKQTPQFRELYRRLVVALPGVRWPADAEEEAEAEAEKKITQDVDPRARAAHLRKLPKGLLERVRMSYARRSDWEVSEEVMRDEGAYWAMVAGDARLQDVLAKELAAIVRYPATVQSIKGLATAGVGKSLRYASAKVNKWWNGS